MPKEEKKPASVTDVKSKVETEARTLAMDKEKRKTLEDGPLSIVKGHETLLLYLTVIAVSQMERRLRESIQSLSDGMIFNLEELKKAVFDIQSRTKTLEVAFHANITRDDAARTQLLNELTNKLQRLESALDEKMSASFASSMRLIKETEDHLLEPLRNMNRDLADSYKITSRTNLLMTEISKKLNDISADLGAMEEALRLEISEILKEEMGKTGAGDKEDPLRTITSKLNEITQTLIDQKARIDSLLYLVSELSNQAQSRAQPKSDR